MTDANRTQEFSVAQRRDHQQDDGCPKCGGPIQAVTRRGPTDVVIQPCGHSVSQTLARDFPRAREDRARADGGEVECEVPEVDEHCGSVQIVLDEEDNVLAMCWECRRKCTIQRVIDEDPDPAMADGGRPESHPFAGVLQELPDLEVGDGVRVHLREVNYDANERALEVEERGFTSDAPVSAGVFRSAASEDGETIDGYVLSGYGTEYYLFVNQHAGEKPDELRLAYKSRPQGRCVTDITEVTE